MGRRIALIGAGQLGSRHLQALMRVDSCPFEVHVVEPSPESVRIAQIRLREVSPSGMGRVSVSFWEAIEQLPGEFDVVIVATSAKVRRACIEEVLGHASVEFFILEKVLFQREEDYAAVGELLANKGCTAWVNCPRRMWPIYREIHRKVAAAAQRVDLLAAGANWGLGCNGIHLLDLYAFLSGSGDIQLDGARLDPDPIPSKREGFLEFTGLLTGTNQQGSSVSLLSKRMGNVPMVIDIAADGQRSVIVEGFFHVNLLDGGRARWEAKECRAPFQSELTNQVIDELWAGGSCSLTSYHESSQLHLKLLRCFNAHLAHWEGIQVGVCPIT